MESLEASLDVLDKGQRDFSEPMFPKNTIGALSLHSKQEPEHGSFLSGEFVMDTQSLQEVWEQIRKNRYTDAVIRVYFNLKRLERIDGMTWAWNLEKNPHLLIEEVSVRFNYRCAQKASSNDQ